MGMTWKLKLGRVGFVLLVVSALALTSGAAWAEGLADFLLDLI